MSALPGATLYVVRYYPTWSETFVAGEIEALRADGHPIYALSLGRRADPVHLPTPPGTWEAPRGLGRLATLPAWRRGRGLPALRSLALRQGWRRAAVACWAAERASAAGVTRVHAHFAGEAAEVAAAIAAQLGVPWSVTAHAADLFVPRPSLGELLRAARAVVTVAEHHREWLEERYGVSAHVVRCGVAPAFFDVAPRRPTPGEPLQVVCVARAAPKKGIEALRDAVAGDPRFALRVVSDAHPADVPAILGGADVFALAARVAADGDRDGVPVAVLEAMAAGLPVIATAVGGIPEVVDDRVGWLVPAGDPARLRDALVSALDPAERQRRGAAARARALAEGWTVAAQARALAAIWRGDPS